MATLVEETGYSYSGVSDVIHNEPEKAKDLLISINTEYLIAKMKQEELEKQLEKVRSQRSHLVSCFLYFMKAMEEDKLIYETGQEVVIVQRLEDNKIDYSAYEKTIFPNT